MSKKAMVKAKVVNAAQPISLSEEYHVGRAVAASILQEYPLYQDPRLTLYVNEVGQTVARKSSRPNAFRGYHFGILDSPEPNAFACPGGLILITRGFLRMCDNEDELAAALAHEVGHVANRDGIKSIKKARWSEVAAIVKTERAKRRGGTMAELVTLYGDAIIDVRKTMAVNGYGRQSEWAADQEALRTLTAAGYNPGALASLLRKMAAHEKQAQAGGHGIHRTHPPAALRLARLKNQGVAGATPTAGETLRTKRFQKKLTVSSNQYPVSSEQRAASGKQ